ncbi:MAG TPA: M23 family metallopeptidase [Burkholderiaceae bacterium]|jgi:murein DD-endopeptidase MepM/ murein hydrolase activator NlpD
MVDGKRALIEAEAFVARHPRALTGTVLGALGCFAVAAFGIAPMAPDASAIPQRMIQQTVETEPLDAQMSALADFELELSRADLTRSSDTADSLLKRMGAYDPVAAKFLRTDVVAKLALQGRPGKMVQVSASADGTVQSMVVRYPATKTDDQQAQFSRLSITRDGDKFSSKLELAPLQSEVRLGSGEIRTSLFAATDESRIPDGVASQMTDMFSGDIDFHRDLKKGDHFSLVYETLTADGEPIAWDGAAGRVLAAEFVNNGRSFSSVWFQDKVTGKGAFYGFDGQSKHHAFLASPLAFSRVTSGFAMRFHPILQTWKQHLGVDYGAPTGTTVRAVGDGTVSFAGWQNGFGNVVQIQHSGNRMTVYAHLSRIDVKKGQRISQGLQVGAVGMTGWATGPHLHFEFRVNGQQKDPRVIARASESVTLPGYARGQFQQTVAAMKVPLSAAESLESSSTSAD